VTERELALRRAIMLAFAETGAPPDVEDRATLDALAEQHAIVLGDDGAIAMAHPFAAPAADARVDSGGRTWWGSCAWDGLGIVAALGLDEAVVTSTGVAVAVAHDAVEPGPVFHVEVPARHWWDDIAHT
jgi:hypothetical protein